MPKEEVANETLEQLDKLGANGLEWLQEFSSKGVGFIEEQAPKLCHEIILLGIVQSAFWVVVSLFIVVVSYITAKKVTAYLCEEEKNGKQRGDNLQVGAIPFIVCGWVTPVFLVPIFTFHLFSSLYNLLAILVAPRLYLLEYFINLRE